jgi:hexokinase
MAVGALGDAPKDLLNEIKHLEELFTIDTAKLKEITNRFVNELTKGEWLASERPTDQPTGTNKLQASASKGGAS